MNRKNFFEKSLKYGICSCGVMAALQSSTSFAAPVEENYETLKRQKNFIENWLSDLIDTMEKELDQSTIEKLFAGTGRGCFNRHQFKKDLSEQGKGDLNRLLEALKKNFEVWQEGDLVHIRYGEVSKGCYCPVLKDFPHKANDPHCNCTRATHQTIFETALGRPFQVDILETVRRGGKTCHFVVHVN